MPDLDIIAFWCCESVIHDIQHIESDSGLTYVCSWEPAPPSYPYSMWWVCRGPKENGDPCWPWAKKKECKHTKEAEKRHCGWDTGPGIGDTGEPVEAQTEYGDELQCPRCGGPVTAQRWGV